MDKQYWLFKTEPSTYSIDDLKREKVTEWWGIRNYQVRNFIRDTMRSGDEALIYHSSTESIGISGRAKIVSEAYPDTQQFDKKSHYFDPKSKQESPSWLSRDVQFEEKFTQIITLAELKQQPELREMLILRPGNRLSITPLTEREFTHILTLAKKKK
ncbi:MAG: EVE domain-containing protein [Patescibacteria group bacterium]